MRNPLGPHRYEDIMVTQGDINKKVAELKKEKDDEIKEMKESYDKVIEDLKSIIEKQKIQHEKWLEETINDLKEEIQTDFDKRLNNVKADLEKKVENQTEILMKIIDKKDEAILNLNLEIKKLSDEAGVVKCESKQLREDVHLLQYKDAELEDRSRRHNLLFYGITEKDNETDQDCEDKIAEIITKNKLVDPGKDEVYIDRAHRLGRRTEEKTRPIIVKFTYYKEKEEIKKNAKNLAGSGLTLCSDYSKQTTEVNKKLYRCAKLARQENPDIKKFYVNYKYVTLVYSVQNRIFRRNFNLKQIMDNPNGWFKPQFKNF